MQDFLIPFAQSLTMLIVELLEKGSTALLEVQVNCQRIPNLSISIIILLCALWACNNRVGEIVQESQYFSPIQQLIKDLLKVHSNPL